MIAKQHGYTLIEIMVALAVFAILAAITGSSMYYAFNTRARVNEQANQLNELQLALTLIERDTEQGVERIILGDEMRTFPPFIGQPKYVEFTRGGIINPIGMEQRSTLQRIAYLCKGKKLVRRRWDVLDTLDRTRYKDKILLDNLKECKLAYMTASHQVLAEWQAFAIQQNQKRESLPMAIQLTLTLQNWGNMSLLFAFPEAVYAN